MRELTGGTGVAVVYDAIGETTFEDGIDALRRRGTWCSTAWRAGRRRRTTRSACRRRLAVPHPPRPPHYTATREELLERAGDVLGWVADGSLDVRIGERYPLEDAAPAHEDLEARRTTGKLLLVPARSGT